MKRIINIVGQRFGKLTVIELADRVVSGGRDRIAFLCVCECGKRKVITSDSLRFGKTKSCGCVTRDLTIKRSTTHGLRHHPLYEIWFNIKSRCYNSSNKRFKDYGGRGISICQEWTIDFKVFYDWCISNGWHKGIQLDRENNDGNYEASNCRFVTPKVNNNNKRNSVHITYENSVKTLSEWAEYLGISTYKVRKKFGFVSK